MSHPTDLIKIRWEGQHLPDSRKSRQMGAALTTLINDNHTLNAVITESIDLIQSVGNPEWIAEMA